MRTGLRSRPTSSCLPPVSPRGFAPRTPLHALSLAASPARSARVARSRGSLATPLRLRPSDFPTRALARRFVGSLRARGSLARLARGAIAASPLGLPDTRSRSPLRRLAPRAWLARAARSATPVHALARRFVSPLRARGSLAQLACDAIDPHTATRTDTDR